MKLSPINTPALWWAGDQSWLQKVETAADVAQGIDNPNFIIMQGDELFLCEKGKIAPARGKNTLPCLGVLMPLSKEHFGSAAFRQEYGLRYAYMTGAMANGIASAELVIAAGKSGLLGSFGSGGLDVASVENAIKQIQQNLPRGPYAFNLLFNPNRPEREMELVELYLRYGVRVVEASAFVQLSLPLVLYRASGFKIGANGNPLAENKVIAKISRPEIASLFMSPPPENLIERLASQGAITSEQVELAKIMPMADDVTIEADSGGHTDGRPLVSLLPVIVSLRNKLQTKYQYPQQIRVGAAGGISTPQAALAAYSMGAAYVVTGSVNQSTVEAHTSDAVKRLLGNTEMADVMLAPAADMFEIGAKVQVLKKGTMYPINAQKLYSYYKRYNSIEDLPESDRHLLERKIFKQTLDEVWRSTQAYLRATNPGQLEKCKNDPKLILALIMRWYLGNSSHWATSGDPNRQIDYQIWCGQSMGAFNAYVKGTKLEALEERTVSAIADVILEGCVNLRYAQQLNEAGLRN